MFHARRKFIVILLAIVVALVPVRVIQAGACMDVDATAGVAASFMPMEHETGNHYESSPCDAHGSASSATGLDESCGQTGCDQCGSCVVALTEISDHLFYAIPIEHSFTSYNAFLSLQVIPPFRPPRA
jgi:hypothetical protein